MLSNNLKKENLIVINVNDTFITRVVYRNIEKLSKDTFNTIFKVINVDYSNDIENALKDIIENISEDYQVIIFLYHDTKKGTISAFSFINDYFLNFEKDIIDTEEWIEYYSGRILESIAIKRFYFDDSWDYLRLTYSSALHEYPIFYNDKLYFISNRYTGNRSIFIWDLLNNTESKIELTSSSEYFPDISPNEKYLAFQTSLYGKWGIMIYEYETQKYIQVSSKDRNAFSPYFYNNTILIYSKESKEKQNQTEIWMYDILNKEKRKIFQQEGKMIFRPIRWNSNKLAFYAIDLDTANSNIYYLDEDLNIHSLISHEKKDFDVWSDGSEYMVFSRFHNGYYRIFLYNSDTNQTRILTDFLHNDTYYATFSEDKKYVFFTLYYRDKDPDIYVIKTK